LMNEHRDSSPVRNTSKPLFAHTNNIIIRNELGRYGIDTISVNENTQQLLLQAANIYGNYYLPYIGNVSNSQSFLISHGTFLVIVDKDADVKDAYNPNANCKTQNNSFLTADLIEKLNLSITMNRNDRYPYLASYQRVDGTNIHIQTERSQLIVCREQPDLYTTMHEIEHVFDNHYLNVTRGSNLLSDFLPPLRVGNLEIRYTENGVRTSDGFNNNGRPPTRQNTDGDNLVEELADTLMNDALDGDPAHPDFGFTNDDAGNARRDDIQNLLEQTWKPNMQSYIDSMVDFFK
jgi:hypothetical protein